MRGWKDSHVDGIITSPPFRDADVEGDYWTWYLEFVNECCRVAKDWVFILQTSRRLVEICRKTNPFRVLCWHKPASRMSFRYEPIFCYRGKEPSYNINGCIWNDSIAVHSVVRFPNHSVGSSIRFDMNADDGNIKTRVVKKGHHPNEDPVRVYSYLARYLAKGGSKIICDPCLGSGTTLVATETLGCESVKRCEHTAVYSMAIRSESSVILWHSVTSRIVNPCPAPCIAPCIRSTLQKSAS